ncbi:MAG TPA: hypothetical protein DEO70_12050 [Bacteroidales bacterium]|nr:MAG: hypothetical protein A2X11_10040 [Bacteroidetes bacterium GWE2_42_24]OFY25852.1 MAG: hypothetical protein A2X09_09415 [Bacteroidetes bacterium GWF2_43_11]HBZ67560.1 hypothetical protein [Bacteroidales bacterium]
MSGIQMIPLEAIVLSQMNPRRTFNEASISELAESILQVGVLSPVIVRPVKKGFELICGARRFKATKLSGLTEIPSIVRKLSDTEALELMITENLQRQDVSPLEEAEAFQNLITHRQYDVQALVTRFGKSEFYIRMRLKLNDLIPEFRELLSLDHIGVSHAMELCKLDGQYQRELFQSQFSNYQGLFWSCPSVKVLKRNIEQNFTLKLENATFSLDDNTLNKIAGSCTSCPQNTASNQLLFPDVTGTGICMDRGCFKQKSETYFQREIARIQDEEPGILLGYPININGEQERELERLVKSGIDAVQLNYNTYETIDQPKKPEAPEASDYDTPEEYEDATTEFFDDLREYESELAMYEKEIKEPEIKRVFLIAGHNKGSFEHVRVKSIDETSRKGDPDQLIKEQIKAMREKDNRNKELEFEKNYNVAKQLFETYQKSYLDITSDITETENRALFALLMESLPTNLVQDLAGLLKNKKEAIEYSYLSRNARYAVAGQVLNKSGLAARLLRSFIFHNCQTGSPSFEINKAEALIGIAIEQYPEQMQKAQEENRNKYLKRKASIEKQIEILEQNAAEVKPLMSPQA